MTTEKKRASIRILIVEDFHADTEGLLRELEDVDLSFEPEIARTEKAFEEKLEEFNPDVILSPYSLGGTNAVKLLGIARQMQVETPFILLAYDLSEDIAIDLLGQGFEDYVQRSTLKRLGVAIKKALQRHKTQLELKLSEARLRSSKASLQEAQKIAKVGSWEWEIHCEKVIFSEEMYRIYDCEIKEFTLETVKEFIHPEDRDRVAKYMVKGLQQGFVPVIEYRIVSGTGETKSVRANAEKIFNDQGEVVKLIGTLQDITERKEIETALKKSRGLLAIGEEVANSGSFELDMTNKKTTWSENLYRITGIDPETEITDDFFLSNVHPEDRLLYKQVFKKIMVSKEVNPLVYRFIRPDTGETIYVHANGKRITAESDKHDKWIGSMQDVTSRIQTQLELEKSQASLMHAQRIAKIGSWEWDVGTERVRWSDEMYRIYEMEKTEVTLSEVRSFIHPEDREYVDSLTEKDLTEELVPVIAYRILLSSGKTKHIISSANQVLGPKGKVTQLIGTLQDVTDQVEAKEALDAERIQRELAVHASQVGVWHWLMDKNELVWDDRCYDIYGRERSAVTPEDFVKFLHPDDRADAQERIMEALAKGDYRADYRIIVGNSVKYLHAQGKATYNDKNEPIRMDGIILDITERHEIQATLKDREQLFRDMAESITEVFWLTDWNLNEVLYVSPRYETLYGQSVESLYANSTSWSKSIHPDDAERVTKKFREGAISGKYDEEYRLLMEDGTVKWVRDRAFPVFNSDGSISRVAGITEEITEQKQAKDRIETLSLVASTTSNGVLIHDSKGKITWANLGFTDITGYSREDVIGLEPWSFLAGADTDLDLIRQTYRKMQAGETFVSDNILVTKGGENVWVSTAFNPIMDEFGNLKQIVSVGVDITRQKELEYEQRDMVQALKKANRELKKKTKGDLNP